MNFKTREEAGCSLAAAALQEWGELKLRATGVSMLPCMWPGDVLTIQSHGAEQITPGEIVLYMRWGRFFIHRVVSRGGSGNDTFLIARGDCMSENDPPVRSVEVLGKVTQIRRGRSAMLPARKLSPFSRVMAYMLCHWGLFRRVVLRFWGRYYRRNSHLEGSLVEAAS
jgi:signal peptidase I